MSLKKKIAASTAAIAAATLSGYYRRAYASCTTQYTSSNGLSHSHHACGGQFPILEIFNFNPNLATTEVEITETSNFKTILRFIGFGAFSLTDKYQSTFYSLSSSPFIDIVQVDIYNISTNTVVDVNSIIHSGNYNGFIANYISENRGIINVSQANGGGIVDVNFDGKIYATDIRSAGGIAVKLSSALAPIHGYSDISISTGSESLIDSRSVDNAAIFSYNKKIGGNITINSNGEIYNENNIAIEVVGDNASNKTAITIGESSYIRSSKGIDISIDNNAAINKPSGISADIELEIDGKLQTTSTGISSQALSLSRKQSLTISEFGEVLSGENAIYLKGGYSTGNNSAAGVEVEINGEVCGGDNGLIVNSGDVEITTGANSNISAINHAIYGILSLSNNTITISGEVTSVNEAAIYTKLSNEVKNLYDSGTSFANHTNNITVQNGANISGNIGIKSNNNGVDIFGTNLVLDGLSKEISITGTGGTAIELSDTDDSITLKGRITIDGNIMGGAGSDNLTFENARLTLTQQSNVVGFETINIKGESKVNGNFSFGDADVMTAANSSLKINGNIVAKSLTVSNNSILSGDNNIDGDVIVNNGGIVSPGNELEPSQSSQNISATSDSINPIGIIGTIAVDGDFTFNNGSRFDVEFGENIADKVTATGNITIDSGAILNLISPESFSGSATILEAGGTINGTFGTVTNKGNNISLIYTPSSIALLKTIALVSVDSSIFNSQLQSSINSSILSSDVLNDQIVNSAFAENRNFWARNIYRNNNVDNFGNSSGTKNNSTGLAAGSDFDLDENYRIGISLSQIFAKDSIKGDKGSREGDALFASIYGIYTNEISQLRNSQFFTSLSLGVGYHDNDNKRLVINNGVRSYAESSSKDKNIDATLQSGIKSIIARDWYALQRISASYIKTNAGGFSENSGGNSAVTIDDFSFSTLKTRESIRFGRKDGFKIFNKYEVSPYFEIGFSQERALTNRNLSGSFITGNKFATTLDNNNRNFFNNTIGMNFTLSENVKGFISYENYRSKNEKRNDARLGMSVGF